MTATTKIIRHDSETAMEIGRTAPTQKPETTINLDAYRQPQDEPMLPRSMVLAMIGTAGVFVVGLLNIVLVHFGVY